MKQPRYYAVYGTLGLAGTPLFGEDENNLGGHDFGRYVDADTPEQALEKVFPVVVTGSKALIIDRHTGDVYRFERRPPPSTPFRGVWRSV